ncbi:MAG: HAD family hydrolase [Gaiella sp.]
MTGHAQALLFDFNGTLSQDEELLCELYQELFAELGKPLTREDYFGKLAGLSEEGIILGWLGSVDHLEALIGERLDRYIRVADGATVSEETCEAVRFAAERVPLGIVSSASRREIEPVVSGAGLDGLFRFVIASEDVGEHKPAPEPYLRAIERLGLPAGDVVAFEDSVAGVTAATAAGVRCLAVAGTAPAERLAAAEAIVDWIDVEIVRTLIAEVG